MFCSAAIVADFRTVLAVALTGVLFGLPSPSSAQVSDDQHKSERAQRQAMNDSLAEAVATAASIDDDSLRNKTLARLSILRQAIELPDDSGRKVIRQQSEANGSDGGLTEADFQSLIDLITGTVEPDSWQATGSGLGTIQPFPAGVYVDASGMLHRADQSQQVGTEVPKLARPATSRSNDPAIARATVSSALRVVSLNELERQIQLLTALGKTITEEMKNLAGLTAVRYVACLPETHDVVIAGPAESWKVDMRGRSVAIGSGKPVLQLDDFVVCLRNALYADGKFGCAIVPRQAHLAATKSFLASSKLKGRSWRTELQKVLGQQDIEVFGIDPTTHAAYVLVEADYRMKLIGMGLEPSIPEVPDYLTRVKIDAAGNAPPLDVARWWFTLNYSGVSSNEAGDLYSFSGSGVKVLSETEFISEQGQRIHTGASHGPTKAFAEDFTAHFDKLADKYPIYQELKNLFDLAVAANLIHRHGLAERALWSTEFFAPEESETEFVSTTCQPIVFGYPMKQARIPREVDSVINHRIIRQRLGTTTRRHTIIGVSGGVSADVQQMLTSHELETTNNLEAPELRRQPDNKPRVWWWDQE